MKAPENLWFMASQPSREFLKVNSFLFISISFFFFKLM